MHHRQRHTHHTRHSWAYNQPSHGHEAAELPLHVINNTPTIEKRAASASTTCTPDDTSPQCELPAGSNSSLPIILGSAIPIVIAVVVLFFLHRRHLKKLRLEEINDKTKSMDFGMGFGAGTRKGNAGEKPGKTRQVSMDLDLGNPYILPGALRGSRESLQSLGKALDAGDPRYGLRPGTSHSRPGTSHSQSGFGASQRSYAPSHHSNLAHSQARESSLYTASIMNGDDSPNGSTTSMSDELLSKAQGMAMSSPPPPRAASLSPTKSKAPELRIPSPPPPVMVRSPSPTLRHGLPAALQAGISSGNNNATSSSDNNGNSGSKELRDSFADEHVVLRETHQHLASHITTESQNPRKNVFSMTVSAPEDDPVEQPIAEAQGNNQALKRTDSNPRPTSDGSNYDDHANPGIEFRFSTASHEEVVQPVPRKPSRDTLAPVARDPRRLSMGFRPLPPDGNPDESAEERALRIRSFYKEYFEETNPDQPGNVNDVRQSFYEDITDSYMPTTHQDDSAPVYDPSSDRFMMPGTRPFAEPPTRRAMTPPPRMPQFNSTRASSSASGRFVSPPGPRSYTSHAGRAGSPYGQPPRRPMPPPSPLQNLPTPSQLGEDAFASPIAFAPRPRVQDVVTGRDTPALRPGERPYSPTVAPHIPLASAFDELPTLMAPHMLRKSGTFTALDFAPPKKFKNDDGMSDAGSVRSGRSQLTAQTVHNIRAGAYRVSRIPQEVVPCKDDITSQLKPTMDLSQRY
ncbi:hypothetical protein BDZ91DRAFT_286410 [Kalaharituber pfeilii]|nr:hypothetical protein BDZ91DRAFT_286410 [Kalaharituber pfeilii]